METGTSKLLRKIFTSRQPTFSWKKICGSGLTSSTFDVVYVCESYEDATRLAESCLPEDDDDFVDVTVNQDSLLET